MGRSEVVIGINNYFQGVDKCNNMLSTLNINLLIKPSLWRRGNVLCCRPTGYEFDPDLGQVSPNHLSCPGGCLALIQLEQFIKRDKKWTLTPAIHSFINLKAILLLKVFLSLNFMVLFVP